MKKFFYVFIILALLAFNWSIRDKYVAFIDQMHPCDKPVTYRTDQVDKQFNVSAEKFRQDVEISANLWNKAIGKEIFKYDTAGKISVNLIYDERQQEQTKIQNLDKQLEQQKSKLSQDITSYRAQVVDFKKRLAEHNSEVAHWNSQGGAPQDVYDRLNAEQKSLQAEADNLNTVARSLNLSTENYNLGVGNLNTAIADFNQDLEKKPEEGIFMGDKDRIEIYFNNGQNELVHTLAHELGHAVGIGHNGNPKSVMYPYTTIVVKLSAEDIGALSDVCRNKSVFELVRQKLNLNR